MKKVILLSIILLIVFSIIIASGCGSGDGNTLPSVPDNSNDSNLGNNSGFLTVQVIWPQDNTDGSYIFLSGNDENTLTASMPGGTTRIEIKIRDAKEVQPNITLPNGEHTFEWNGDKEMDFHTLGPLPVIKVIVRAEAYDSEDILLGEAVEKEYEIKAGNNTVPLDLGDYNLILSAEEYYGYKGKVMDDDDDDDREEYTITANLSIIYPTEINKPSLPVPGKDINFIVTGNASLEVFDDTYDSAGIRTTDNNGLCSINVRLDDTDPVVIQGIFRPVPDEPPYVGICIINGTGKESDKYKLSFTYLASSQIMMIPNFDSPSPDGYKLVDEVPQNVWLKSLETDMPVSGKQINFSIIDVLDYRYDISYPEFLGAVSLSKTSDITDADGACYLDVICNQAMGKKRIVLRAEVAVDPDNPLDVASAGSNVRVTDCLAFANYCEELELGNFPGWSIYLENSGNKLEYDGDLQSRVLHLEGPTRLLRNISRTGPKVVEVRFKVKVASGSNCTISLQMRDANRRQSLLNFQNGIIYDVNSQNLSGYVADEWYTGRLQFIFKPSGSKVNYWTNGKWEEIDVSSQMLYQDIDDFDLDIYLSSGTASFDDIEVYRLDVLPQI